MKNIIKKTMLLLFVGSFVLSTLTLANGRIVYGKNCIGQGGTVDCYGWKVFISTEMGKGNVIPVLDLTAITDGMIFPNFPTTALSTSRIRTPYGLVSYHFDNPTYIIITDPKGIQKKFTYFPFRSNGQPYIQHDEIRNTGGASLNKPENGSVTIEGSAW